MTGLERDLRKELSTLKTGTFHCSTRTYLLDLIDFIEEKITEALQRPNCAVAALEEASGAIAPIEDRLNKEENNPLRVALAFEISYVNLKPMSPRQLSDFIEKNLKSARSAVNYFTD